MIVRPFEMIFVKNIRMTKKEQAREMYMLSVKQVDIARILQVTNETITNWKKAGDWEDARLKREMLDVQNEEAVREITAYQLAVMKKKKEDWLEAGEMQLFDNASIQSLRYLFNCYKTQWIKWEHYVKVVRNLLEFVETHDKTLAKELMNYTDMYLAEKGKLFDE